MSITINLKSGSSGEIKRFLESFYEKEINLDDDVEQWIYVYNKPLDAIDIISAVIDNSDRFQISMEIQNDCGDIYPVNLENHNDIIKSILYVFYEEGEKST